MILDVYNSLSSLKSAKKWFEFCTTGFTKSHAIAWLFCFTLSDAFYIHHLFRKDQYPL